MVASSLRSISPSPHTNRDPAPYGFYDARLPTSRSRSTAAATSRLEDDDALEVLAAPISLRVDHHLEDDLDNFLSLDLESMQHQARRGGRASYDSCSSGPHPRRSFNGAAGGCGGGAGNGSGSFGDDLPGAKARKILGITAGFDLGFDDDDDDDNVNGDGLDEIHAQQQGRIGRRRRNSTSTTNSPPTAATSTTRNKKRLSIVAGLARRSAGATAPKNKSLLLNGGGGASATRSDDESFAGGRQKWPSALRSNSNSAAAAANSMGRPGSRGSSHHSSSNSSSSAAISSSTISSTLLRPRNTLAAATAGVVAAQTEDEASSGTTATNAASSYKRDRDPVVVSSKVTPAAAAAIAPMVSLSLKSPLSPLPPPSCDWTPPSNWLSRSPSNHSQSSLALPTTPSLPRTSAEGFLFARTSSDISMPMTPTSSSGGASGGTGSGKKSSARFDAYLKRLRAPRGSHSSASTTEGATSGEDAFIMPGFPKTPSSSTIPPPLPSPSSVSLRDLMLWEKSLETSQKNAQWQSMVEHRPRLHRQRPISSSNASSHSSLEYGARGNGGAPSLMTSGSASASASASTLNLFDNESLLLQHGGWASSEEHHGGERSDVVVDLRSSADHERRGSLAPYPFCASHREDEAFELLDERVGLVAATTTTATATATASTTPTGDEAKAFPVRPPLNTSKSMPVGLGIQEEERETGRSNSVDDNAVALHPFKTWDATGDAGDVTKRARGRSVDAPVQDIKTPPLSSSGTPALVLSPRRGAISSRRSRLGAGAGGAATRPPPQAPLLEHHLLPPPAVPAGQVTGAAPAAPAAAVKAPLVDNDDEDETAPLFDSASEALLLELEAEIRYASTASVPLDSADDRFGQDYFGGEEQEDYERWLATASAHGQPRKAPAPPSYSRQEQQQRIHEWPRRPSWAGSDVVSSAKSKRMSALEAWAEERRGSTTSTTSSVISADGGGGVKRGDDGLLIILPPTSSYGDVEKATAAKVGTTGRLRVPV